MPSTYTVNLGIEKPATGEQSGTWGDTVNDNSNILDEAINGVVSITLASAGSSGSPNSITITNGASSTGRNKWIEFADGGDLGAAAYVQLTPNDAEKICFIRNSLTASRSIFLFQGTYDASNDLEIVAGTDVVVKFNGGGTGATVVNVYANLKVDGIVATTADINGGTVDGTVIGGAAAAALTATTVVANTSLNIAGTTTISSVLDEDNMASDSATALATQQSIKAYVDSQVGTVDTLSEILANGNTTGANDIDVDAAQKVQFRDAAIYINSSVDGQLDIVADTEIQIAATTVDLNGNLDVSGTTVSAGKITADAGIDIDNINIDGTTIALSSGDLTLDVAGDIILDAAGTQVILKKAGTQFGEFLTSSTPDNLYIKSSIQDKDIIFGGNDGGADITALTLDMSEAGEATFNGDIRLNDSKAARFGTDQDFRISFDGTNAVLQNVTSDSDITFLGNDGGSTITAFSLDMSAEGAATFSSTIAATVATLGTSSVGTDNTAPAALILRHESDQTSGFDDNFGVGMKFNADASNGGYATHAELSATQKSTGYQLRFKVGGTERLNLDSTGGFVTTPAAAGHAVFNEDGVDSDFRVESDTNTHMLFVDGGANHVNIGTATDLGGTLNVLGNTAISGTTGGAYVATGATLSIQGTGTFNSNYFGSSLATVAIRSNEPANNSWNPTLHITTIRQSLGTNENSTGGIGFTTVDDSNNTGIDDAARIQVINLAPSSATSATGLVFYNNVGGSKTQAAQAVFKLVPIEAAFNDDSADIDFRVESNNQSEMLIVNAGTDLVGIKGNPAGANGVLQVTGSIGLTGNAEIRQSTNADGSTLRFLGTQLVIANSNGNGYSYSGGGLVASVAPASGAIMLDVGAVDTSGHRLKVINGGDGIQGSLQYLSSTTARLNIDSATGAFTTTPTTAGHAVFNEDGVDADFRVESSGNADMLFVDAGNNRVGVGMSTPLEPLHATGRILSTTTYGGSTQRIGTSIGQNGNTRADIDFRRWTGASTNHGVGMIEVADTGIMRFYVDSVASNTPATTERISLDPTGAFTTTPAAGGHAVFNEGGADADFRVESDGNANMLFVDGGNSHIGMGTATLNRSGLGADHIVLTVGADTEMGMLELQGTRTSDADLGRISFLNAGTRRAEIVAARIDADNSTKLYFQTSNAGSLGTRLTIGKDGAATFNSSVSTPTLSSPDGTGILTLANTGEAQFNRGIVVNEILALTLTSALRATATPTCLWLTQATTLSV
jgi:hypothetical protein